MSRDYVYFMFCCYWKLFLRSWELDSLTNAGKPIKKQSEMHFRWNHCYQSADDFIYPKDIIRTETELAFLFMQYIKNTDFRILASVCVFPFLKKKKPQVRKNGSPSMNLCTLYTHSSPNGLSEKAETQKKTRKVLFLLTLHTSHN